MSARGEGIDSSREISQAIGSTKDKVEQFLKNEELIIEQLRKMPRRRLIVGAENPSPFETIHTHWGRMSQRFRLEFGILLTEAIIEAQELTTPKNPISVDDIARIDAIYADDSKRSRTFFIRLKQSLSNSNEDSVFQVRYGYRGSVILTEEDIKAFEENEVEYDPVEHAITFTNPTKVIHIDGKVPLELGNSYAHRTNLLKLSLTEVKKFKITLKENIGVIIDLFFRSDGQAQLFSDDTFDSQRA